MWKEIEASHPEILREWQAEVGGVTLFLTEWEDDWDEIRYGCQFFGEANGDFEVEADTPENAFTEVVISLSRWAKSKNQQSEAVQKVVKALEGIMHDR